MRITINRTERDALYAELLTDLAGVGDIYHVLHSGDVDAARDLWRSYEAEFRLLDQLGWRLDDPREQFVVDIPHELHVRALEDLRDLAQDRVTEPLAEPRRCLDIAERALQVLGAYRDALAPVPGRPVPGPDGVGIDLAGRDRS